VRSLSCVESSRRAWGSCSWSRRSRRLWRRLSRLLHPSTKPLKQQTSHKTLSMFVVACFGDDVGGLDQPLWLSLQQPRQWSREPARLGIILVQPGTRADPTDEGAGPAFIVSACRTPYLTWRRLLHFRPRTAMGNQGFARNALVRYAADVCRPQFPGTRAGQTA
jgi:hypothetical protein